MTISEIITSVDAGYEMFGGFQVLTEQLAGMLQQAERDRIKARDKTLELIKAGQTSGNPFRDFVFAKLGGRHHDQFTNRLREINGLIVSNPHQLALVIECNDYTPLRGGLILDGEDLSRPVPEPAYERVVRLGITNGTGLILDPRDPSHVSLPIDQFLERSSLLDFNSQEIDPDFSTTEPLKSGPCRIDILARSFSEVAGSRLKPLINRAGQEVDWVPITELPYIMPQVVIGDQAVKKWMLDHSLHHESGGIPSFFYSMCAMLDHPLPN